MNRLRILNKICQFYDFLKLQWRGAKTFLNISRILLFSFLAGIIIADLKLKGHLPDWNALSYIHNHFFAIELAFTLLLFAELIELIFSMDKSIGNSVGKQFEILSLILIRSSFKEFTKINEPIEWNDLQYAILHISSDAFGGLLIFILLGIYYKIYKNIRITKTESELKKFRAYKKLIGFSTLVFFIILGISDIGHFFKTGDFHHSFQSFYTFLIFSDISFLLIALRFHPSYYVLFRYSAFVLTTVLIRISLIAPPFYNAIIGTGAIIFTLLLSIAFNKFTEGIKGI